MDETQKTELSQIMKNAIGLAMEKKDFSVISLIEYCRKNQLFFDQYYESSFVIKLSELKFLRAIEFLNYHEYYGLNKKQVSTFFSSYAKEELSNFLIEMKDQYANYPPHRMLAAKFSLVLDKKLFFDPDFFEQNVFQFVDDNTLKKLIEQNTSNFESYLQSELKIKKDSPHKIKI